jgi:glutathione S-transferase
MSDMSEFEYVYFGLDWRMLPVLLTKWQHVELKVTAGVPWPDMKSETPFGILPVLRRGGELPAISSSVVINRFLVAGTPLEGIDLEDRLRSEQLQDYAEDLLQDLVSAKNQGGAALATYLDPSSKKKGLFATRLPPLVAQLNAGRLHPVGAVTLGELAIFDVFVKVDRLAPNFLQSFPDLAAWYSAIASTKEAKEYLQFLAPLTVYVRPEHLNPAE